MLRDGENPTERHELPAHAQGRACTGHDPEVRSDRDPGERALTFGRARDDGRAVLLAEQALGLTAVRVAEVWLRQLATWIPRAVRFGLRRTLIAAHRFQMERDRTFGFDSQQ